MRCIKPPRADPSLHAPWPPDELPGILPQLRRRSSWRNCRPVKMTGENIQAYLGYRLSHSRAVVKPEGWGGVTWAAPARCTLVARGSASVCASAMPTRLYRRIGVGLTGPGCASFFPSGTFQPLGAPSGGPPPRIAAHRYASPRVIKQIAFFVRMMVQMSLCFWYSRGYDNVAER